jgi:uncharacterized membrane protein YfhO
LRVTAPDGGLLVVNEAFYPGWEARVDGVPTSVYHANYLFIGIPLAAGDHVVTLEYRPMAVPLGAITSVVTILVVCLLVGLRYRRAWHGGWGRIRKSLGALL